MAQVKLAAKKVAEAAEGKGRDRCKARMSSLVSVGRHANDGHMRFRT